MERGSMRLEPNISLRVISYQSSVVSKSQLPSYKVEVKNINSFNFVKRAIEYEVNRQIGLLEQGNTPPQETRGWSEAKQATYSQRIKEEADDYRYFPEPDIPPMRWTKEYVEDLRKTLPELPDTKIKRFREVYKLRDYDASVLTETQQLADYFEECARVAQKQGKKELTAKKMANWLINRKINLDEVLPAQLAAKMLESAAATTISEEKLEKVIRHVLAENQKAVTDYRKGKQQALMFLVGKVRIKIKQIDYPKILKLIKDNL